MTIDRPNNYVNADALSPWGKVKAWSANNPRLSRVVWFAVGLGLLLLLIWAIYPQPQRNARGGGPGGRGGQTAQPVGVATAVRGDINVTVNALGTVTPLATATVRPQVSGMLMKINFTEGQMVKAGDVLAEIDPRTYKATLDQQQAILARDSATLANEKVDLTRYEQLVQQNAISQQQLATQQAAVRSTAATVASDQANVENARINLGYTRIVSPVTGRVGLHLVDVGNIVSNGQSNGLVVVTQLTPMSVLFTVPEDNVAEIQSQISQGNTLSVDAYDRSQTNKIASGKLATVDNVIDPTTGSVKLRAIFDNADGKLFPSQFVNTRLLVTTLHDQIVIPVPAIQRGADGTFVFVVSPDKTVTQRTVKTGIQDNEKIAITEGLAAGDTVVVDGADRLRDGAEVQIPNAKGAIKAPSAGGAAPAGAARARGGFSPAIIAKVTEACVDDIKKYCSTPEQLAAPPRGGNGGGGGGGRARGPVTPQMQQLRCLTRHRSDLGSQCMAALPARGQRGAGGGFGGGGGFP